MDDRLLVANEFAAVRVSVDRSGHSPRLLLEDMRGGRVTLLDALELEGLVWAGAQVLAELVDPAARWNDQEEREERDVQHHHGARSRRVHHR